jgi:hypothetical protein
MSGRGRTEKQGQDTVVLPEALTGQKRAVQAPLVGHGGNFSSIVRAVSTRVHSAFPCAKLAQQLAVRSTSDRW